MDRLGSPPAAALLEAGRGGTAGGAEITSWASSPLSECHFKPPCAFFSIGWRASLSFQTQSFARAAEQCSEEGMQTTGTK